MYAVVETGGKQVRVAPGDVVRVERLEGEVGSAITLDVVKLLVKDDGFVIDPSALASATVSCTITDQARDKKVRVFKKKKRKKYRKLRGHRQYYTELKIDAIDA
jgi:large subunit ribosomal protein L21